MTVVGTHFTFQPIDSEKGCSKIKERIVEREVCTWIRKSHMAIKRDIWQEKHR